MEEEDVSASSHDEQIDDGEDEKNDMLTPPMLPPNTQPVLVDALAAPMAHLNNFLTIHPQLLAKFNMEVRSVSVSALPLDKTTFLQNHVGVDLGR